MQNAASHMEITVPLSGSWGWGGPRGLHGSLPHLYNEYAIGLTLWHDCQD